MRRLALVGVLLAAATAPSLAPAADMPRDMRMVGNMASYPNLRRAGAANVRRARRLLAATRAAAPRFATLAQARRLGYVSRQPPFRPGFTHLRRHGMRFWGRTFDPAHPQALVFWCPRQGACALANFMYRAPAGMPPSTWGDLLQWHRHGTGARSSWMTHVWLVKDVRTAFATCAPLAALERDLGLATTRWYPFTVHELSPCA